MRDFLSSVFEDNSEQRLKEAKEKVTDAKHVAEKTDQRLHREAQIRLLEEIARCENLKTEIKQYKPSGELTLYQDYYSERNSNYWKGGAALLLLSITIASSAIIYFANNGCWGPMPDHDPNTGEDISFTAAQGILLGSIFPLMISAAFFVLTLILLHWQTLLADAKDMRLSFALMDKSAKADAVRNGASHKGASVNWGGDKNINRQAALSFLNSRKAEKEMELKTVENQNTLTMDKF